MVLHTTARKLQPHWDGKWTVIKLKGPCNLELTNGSQSKVVHVNHVRHRLQTDQHLDPSVSTNLQKWNFPDLDHYSFPPSFADDGIAQRCYPL